VRLILALLVMLLPPQAIAASWGHYTNARFGYAVDVPPGFVGQGESDNSDGQVFKTPTAALTVYGANILDGGFEDEVKQRQHWATNDGWAITYQVTTPSVASYSGKQGARILYVRMIPLCDGSQFAAFELEYSRVDLQKFDAVVTRLVQSLKAPEGSASCN
jgi:hypothetical protein